MGGRHRSGDGSAAPTPTDDEYVVDLPPRHTARQVRSAGLPVGLRDRLVPIGTGVAVILILLVRPSGLLGQREA